MQENDSGTCGSDGPLVGLSACDSLIIKDCPDVGGTSHDVINVPGPVQWQSREGILEVLHGNPVYGFPVSYGNKSTPIDIISELEPALRPERLSGKRLDCCPDLLERSLIHGPFPYTSQRTENVIRSNPNHVFLIGESMMTTGGMRQSRQ